MEPDTLRYDSLDNRPLPKWLTDHKAQSELAKGKEKLIQKVQSLHIAMGVTVLLILLFVLLFTFRIVKRSNIKR